MKRLTIPAILAATILVAGAFAFMPVQQASTVHTTLAQATTLTEVKDTDGEDFTLTCPASTTCHILDVYLIDEDTGANDADIGTINLTFAEGEVLELAVDADNTAVNDDVAAVNNVSGVAMPASSNIVFAMDTDGSTDYTLVVVIETDGTGTPSLT